MESEKYLSKVKDTLLITGTFQDAAIQELIQEVVTYLLDTGVKEENITPGIVARGVSDLWGGGAGTTRFSEYFIQRAIQLCYKEDPDNESIPTEFTI